MIRKMLRETPRAAAEWIWWVDIDTLMPDMAVLPRFEAYEGADLVVLGHQKRSLFQRWWSGSSGAYVSDLVDCSVLVGRHNISAEAFEAELIGRVELLAD